MKKFLLLPLLVFMTAFILPACSNDDNDVFTGEDSTSNDTLQNNTPIIIKYNGTLVVNGNYIKEGAICGIKNMQTTKLTLDIYKVKFAEAMPVEIDITIPEIPFDIKTGTFSGDSIIPNIGVAPAPMYTFTRIDGCVNDTALSFSASLNRGTFTFNGKILR